MTDRAYRLLLRAYPRSLRAAHGDDMVQLVQDRRQHEGTPGWRLWPWLLADTVRGAVPTRVDHVLGAHRALVLGTLGAFAALAALSDGLPAGVPFVVLALLLGVAVVQRRPAPDVEPRRRSGARWAVAGGLLLTVGFGAAQLIDREATELEWALMFTAVVGGLFATATGLALLAGARRHALTG